MREEDLHLQVCNYLKAQYPSVIFITDLSGIKLTIGQAKKLKKLRSNKGIPDLFIAERNSKYNGLFIEIKTKSVFKKDGTLKKQSQKVYKNVGLNKVCIGEEDHLIQQNNVLEQLKVRGFKAVFGCGFDDIKAIIDDYFSPKYNYDH